MKLKLTHLNYCYYGVNIATAIPWCTIDVLSTMIEFPEEKKMPTTCRNELFTTVILWCCILVICTNGNIGSFKIFL